MSERPMWIACFIALTLVGVVIFSTTAEARGLDIETPNNIAPIQTSIPQYSEKCPHGHNGFDCEPSTLEDRVDELEKRVSLLE